MTQYLYYGLVAYNYEVYWLVGSEEELQQRYPNEPKQSSYIQLHMRKCGGTNDKWKVIESETVPDKLFGMDEYNNKQLVLKYVDDFNNKQVCIDLITDEINWPGTYWLLESTYQKYDISELQQQAGQNKQPIIDTLEQIKDVKSQMNGLISKEKMEDLQTQCDKLVNRIYKYQRPSALIRALEYRQLSIMINL